MKKAFIALAVAAGAIASAHADTTTLYGNIGYQADFMNLNTIKDASDKGNAFVKALQHGVNLSDINKTKIGVKGTEELGHGISAMFGYEFGIDKSAGINSTKKAYVGFTGDFGTLTLGNKGNVYGDYLAKADYFNAASVFDSVDYPYHGGVRYDVPSFVDGVDGSIAYDFLGQTIEVGAGFNMYGVDLGAALQYNWGRTPGLTTGGIKSDRDGKAHIRAGVSAAYENDMFQVAADYQFKQASNKDADNAQHLVGLGAGFKVTGDSTLYAGGQLDAMNLNKEGATQRFGLGYEYNLSKRTKSFVEFDGNREVKVINDTKDSQYNFNAYIGLRHKF